ncbi:DUF3494_domain-containing protein [Hexamita inflata]|uniref:DUF3494 domain-containing protein n=1 Tax=Hexamita inflata TaxID=28002 RepID=A0AA86V2N1_9EUKA|nr:DUF3494 domain-containing protein [Hexamita inflata]
MNQTQNLVNFSASCNNLTGDIPESFDSLQNLVYVDVKCNSQLNCSTHHTQPINLGTAEKYSILAETAITTTGSTVISGDMGISPNGASSITGFQLSLDVSGQVSSAPNVNGNIYASDYTPTTPGDLTIAINDMETAYTIASQSIPSATELGGGSIGGINFVPGVYKWSSPVNIATNIILYGSSADVWIFIIAQTLDVFSSVTIGDGCANSNNIIWVVAGAVTIHEGVRFTGTILAKTNVALLANVKISGKILAQTAITLISNQIGFQYPIYCIPLNSMYTLYCGTIQYVCAQVCQPTCPLQIIKNNCTYIPVICPLDIVTPKCGTYIPQK